MRLTVKISRSESFFKVVEKEVEPSNYLDFFRKMIYINPSMHEEQEDKENSVPDVESKLRMMQQKVMD